ncbi:MAG TPA: LysE family transporter [Ktedonobacterales bacterium]|nr:LysE family transporter [Ktedonobacterales bacterium]
MSALIAYGPQLLALLGVWALAVITPGPDFVATSRYAVARSRRDGVLVGLGVAAGIAIWVTLSLAGLGFVMAQASGPLAVLRFLGALYLIWLGAQALWSAARPKREVKDAAINGRRTDVEDAAINGRRTVSGDTSHWPFKALSRAPALQGRETGATREARWGRLPSWLIGFLTNISNPKALAFFSSIFALLLPARPPFWLDVAILAGMVGISAGWFSLVALLFSLAPVARAYRRAQRWIDAITGGIFVALGLRLATNG